MTKEGIEIKKDFIYKGRRCVVLEIDRGAHAPLKWRTEVFTDMWKPYCTGYVELKPDEVKESYDDYGLESEEFTFQDTLKHFEKQCEGFKAGKSVFIGFDTAHVWNDQRPESKKPESVAKVCKKIVEELNKKEE